MNRSRAAWLFILVAFLIAHVFSHSARAAFAPHINYQGKLADETGTPVPDDLYNMEFILYDDPTAGSAVWTETLTGADRVPVTDGLFSVLLGEVTPFDIPDLNQPLYLSVNIGGTSTPAWDGEMMPRRALSTVPSAFLASTALSLDATNATATNATTTSLYVSGGLGVGTSTPASSMLAIKGSASKANIFEISSSTNANILTVTGTGNIGIGTSSPYAKLSVVGQVVGEYFTATSTIATSTLPLIAGSGLASGNLILQSTTHGTKGRIYLEGTDPTSGTGLGMTVTNNSGTANLTLYSGSSGNQAQLSASIVTATFKGAASCSSAECYRLGATGMIMAPSYIFTWAPDAYNGVADIGLARDSAGVLRITNGSSGGGSLKANFFTATSTTGTSTFAGVFHPTGKLADTSGSGGVSGNILQSTGTGISWVATSSLGLASQWTDGGSFDYDLEEVYVGTSTQIAGNPLFAVGTSSTIFSVASSTQINLNNLNVLGNTLTGVSSLTLNASAGHVTINAQGGGSYVRLNGTGVEANQYGVTSGGSILMSGSTGSTLNHKIFIRGNAAGTNAMAFTSVPSGVNYLEAIGSVTGSAVLLNATGTDSTVHLSLQPKGGGNVGIGTTSPFATLSVAGQVAGDYFTATSPTGTSTLAGGFSAAGTAGLSVLQNGKVGIGTAAPSYPLTISATDVAGSAVENGAALFVRSDATATGNKGGAIVFGDLSRARAMIKGLYDDLAGGTAGHLAFSTRSGNVMTEQVRIDHNGNVGIGEASPGSRLSVSGGGTFGASYDIVSAPTNGLLVEGSVGIGTTTPGYVLHVIDNVANGTSFAISDGPGENRVVTVDALNHQIQLGDIDAAVNGTRFSLIDSLNQFLFENGSVGIGSTSPQARLVVKGEVGLSSIFEIASSTDANILKVTSTGLIDAGGGLSFELPNGAAPTVNIFGQLAADNNLWGAGRGAALFYDGTAATALLGVLVSDTPGNGQVPKWNTGGTITWEDDNTSAGAGISTIEEGNSSVTTGASRLDFLGTDFTVATDGGAAEADVSIDYANSGITRVGQNETITGDWAFTMAGTESLNLTSDLAGTVNVLSVIGTPSASAGTAQGLFIQQANSANSNGLDSAITVDNADTDLALADGLLITSAAGLITDAIDVSDAEISNALKTGANFVAFDGLRIFEGTTGTMTIEDSSGNDVITLVDDGTTGSLTVTGTTSVSGMGIHFTDTDTNPGCGSGDYGIYADTSETMLKKCVNGVVTDLQEQPDVITAQNTNNVNWTDTDTTDLWITLSELQIVVPVGGEVLVLSSTESTSVDPGVGAVSLGARIDREGAGVASDCADVNTVGTPFAMTPEHIAAGTAAHSGNASVAFVDTGTTAGGTFTYAVCTHAGSTVLTGTWALENVELTLINVNDAGDLAEVYPTNDETLEPGEIVSIDPTFSLGVKRSSGTHDKNVLGIVATKPALVMGNRDGAGVDGKPIALSGRVPVKVTIENGVIRSGDVLVPGSIPGTAMRGTRAGTMVGVALEAFEGEGVGTVVAFVKTGQYTGTNLRELLEDPTTTSLAQDQIGAAALAHFMQQKDALAGAINLSEILTDRLAAGLEIITPTLIADTVEVAHLMSTNPDGTITFGTLSEDSIGTTSTPAITFDAQGNAFFAGVVSAGGFALDGAPVTSLANSSSTGTSTETLLGLLFGSPEILNLSDRIGHIETGASTTDATLGTLSNTTAIIASTTDELARRVNEIEAALSESPGLTLNTGVSSTTGADENITEDTGTFLEEIEDRVATAVEILADLFIGGLDSESLVARSISAFSLYARNIFADTITIIPDGRIIVPAGQDQTSGTSFLPAGATEIDIENAHVLSTSKIFITPISLTKSPLVVTLKQVGIGFTVGTLEPSNHDVVFDWLLIDTYPTDPDTTSRPNETVVEDNTGTTSNTPEIPAEPIPPQEETLPGPELEVIVEPASEPVPTPVLDVPQEAAPEPEPEPPPAEPEPTPDEDPAPESEQE